MTGAPTRARFAPSPTGYLHVGSATTALKNWLFARHTGGTLILRIEDTDAERSRQDLVDQTVRTLAWLGIDFDEGPYFQSERRDLYDAAVERLLAGGHAYRCDCTREELDARKEAAGEKTPGYDGHCREREVAPGPGVAVRFRTPDDRPVVFEDAVRGEVRWDGRDLEDFVVQRADGSPTFLLANAVDDAEMGVTHAVRGEDLLNTAPKVHLLWEALGHTDLPVYAHLPILVNEQRKKLSKRRDDVSVEDFRARGYLPEAFANFIALLGWGPPDGVEVRPMSEIVDLFRLEDVTKAPAFFDHKKLDHFNGEHIRRLEGAEFVERARPWLEGESAPWDPEAFDAATFEALAPLVQERVTTLADVPEMVDFLFRDAPDVDEAAWEKVMGATTSAPILADVADAYATCEWRADALHAALLEVGERHGLKLGKAQAPVRMAVTGRTVGPPLFESLEVLGRERTLARIEAARARVAG